MDQINSSRSLVPYNFTITHINMLKNWIEGCSRRQWQPTPVLLPGKSKDGGAWWAAVYGVAQSQTRLKRLSSSSRRLFWMNSYYGKSASLKFPWSQALFYHFTFLCSTWIIPFTQADSDRPTHYLAQLCILGNFLKANGQFLKKITWTTGLSNSTSRYVSKKNESIYSPKTWTWVFITTWFIIVKKQKQSISWWVDK